MKKLNMKEHVFNWKSSRILKVQVLTAGAVLAIGLAAVPAVTAHADDAANVQSETAVSVAQTETGTEVQETESDTPSVIPVSRDGLPAALGNDVSARSCELLLGNIPATDNGSLADEDLQFLVFYINNSGSEQPDAGEQFNMKNYVPTSNPYTYGEVYDYSVDDYNRFLAMFDFTLTPDNVPYYTGYGTGGGTGVSAYEQNGSWYVPCAAVTCFANGEAAIEEAYQEGNVLVIFYSYTQFDTEEDTTIPVLTEERVAEFLIDDQGIARLKYNGLQADGLKETLESGTYVDVRFADSNIADASASNTDTPTASSANASAAAGTSAASGSTSYPDSVGDDPSPLLSLVIDDFYHTTGIGGWQSTLHLNDDGTFTGGYYNWGQIITESDFSGRFTDFEKVDDYTWKMHLESVQTERPEGETWTDADGIEHIAAGAVGISGGDTFYLYLPGHPWNTLPEGYLSWAEIYILDNSNPGDPLPYCGIYNEATEAGWGS